MRINTYSTLVENTHLETLLQLVEQERQIRLAKANISPGGKFSTHWSIPKVSVHKRINNWMKKTLNHSRRGSLNQTAI